MAKTEVKRDFKVLAEKISPENVLVMSELLAIKETKTLTCYMGSLAEKAHAKLCKDVFCKDIRGYVLSDFYDMVQSVAPFLCEHFGEYLNDFLYISNRGKRTSIKVECYHIIERALCGRYRTAKRCISLERVQAKLQYIVEETEEEDYALVDAVIASLNLTENMNLALDYRMSGMSYPDIAKMMSRATSTVYEYFMRIRQDIPPSTGNNKRRLISYSYCFFTPAAKQQNKNFLSEVFQMIFWNDSS